MAKLKIETGADNPILRKKSSEVQKFDASLKRFAKNLLETMICASGLGIAAPQVGKHIRVFIVTLDYGKKDQRFVTMVNPEISNLSVEKEIGEEGCLSIPGVFDRVERSYSLSVKFCSVEGVCQVLDIEGLDAREVQHENDHLEGILFVDKLVN